MKTKQTLFGKDYPFFAALIFVLLIVSSIAFLGLREAFSGDQALFLTFSKGIDSGAVLYRDLWDIKQPAIFVFYLIGGKLFGFSEVGIHLLELIYWLTFSVIMAFGLRKHFANPAFAALTPLLTVGIYYSVSGSLHFAQVEVLVCFPLFLVVLLAQKYLENPDNMAIAFFVGVCAGVVVTFKLILGLIVLALVCGLFVFVLYRGGTLHKVMGATIAMILGSCIPVAAVLIYFFVNDSLAELFYVTFTYPVIAVATVTMENRVETLSDGLSWFFKSFFPVIVLTLLLLLFLLTSRVRSGPNEMPPTERNFIFPALFIWLFAGFFIILIQRLSWWEYHFLLLMIPVGILGVKSLETIIGVIHDNLSPRRIPAYAALGLVILILFLPVFRRLAHRVHLYDHAELVRVGDRESLVTGNSTDDYLSISADTQFLTTLNPKPALFVVSNPLYYYLSGVPPAYASNGAMSDMFTKAEWDRLNREIADHPPEYIFIEDRLIEPTRERDAAFSNTLFSRYEVFVKGGRGSFYRLRGLSN